MSHPVSEKSALVVSAHSADFVWRAGGAIALHALQGYQVHVVCLSFGERGESAKLWRKGNMTEEAVKQVRREEAQAAAAILGASVEFFDIGVLLDITAVWEKKYQAIQCMQGQEHLWEYYTRVALQRGVQAKRNIGITAARDIVHGEAFQSIFPRVTENLA